MFSKILVGIVGAAVVTAGSLFYYQSLGTSGGCSGGTCPMPARGSLPPCCQPKPDEESTPETSYREVLSVMPREVH